MRRAPSIPVRPPFPNWPVAVFGYLFAVAVCVFPYMTAWVFTPTEKAPYIIDIRLQECLHAFFDAGYVRDATPQYKPLRYLLGYWLLDTFFIFVYTRLFYLMASAWKGTSLHRLLFWIIVISGVADFCENSFFALQLFHPTTVLTWMVATCTTIKSVAFLLSLTGALLAFFAPHLGDRFEQKRVSRNQLLASSFGAIFVSICEVYS